MRYRIPLVLIALFLGCLPASADNKETVKTVIPTPGSDDAKHFIKHEIVTDGTGRRLRMVNYLTDGYAKENGFYIQIDEYDPKGFPSRFTMLFTKDYESTTGFSKRVDYVDENDVLLKADFYDGDTFVFAASKGDLEAFERYPPRRMGRFFEDNHSETLKENEYTVEAPIFGGTTHVTYLNSTKTIGSHEKNLIASWSKMHGAEGFIPVYNREVLVKEKGKQFWVCFQDDLIQYLTPDLNMTLRYYYIGESIEGMTFLVTFMTEIHAPPPGASALSQRLEQDLPRMAGR